MQGSCDVVSCNLISNTTCYTCRNLICQIHTNLQKDAPSKTRTHQTDDVRVESTTTTVKHAPMCPDCWWIHKKPFVVRPPTLLCCLKFGQIMALFGVLLVVAAIAIIVLFSIGVISPKIGWVILGAALVFGSCFLYCFFLGGRVRNHNRCVEEAKHYKKQMMCSNGNSHRFFSCDFLYIKEIKLCGSSGRDVSDQPIEMRRQPSEITVIIPQTDEVRSVAIETEKSSDMVHTIPIVTNFEIATENELENQILQFIRDQADYKAFVLFDSNPEIDLFNALCVACHYGTVRMMHYLVERGAKINVSTFGKFSPLHIAAARNDGGEYVRGLLDYGADVNLACDMQDSRGWTPLHVACFNGNKITIQILIQKLANLNAVVDFHSITPGKYSPLALACGSNSEILEILVNAGADVNGKGVLHAAVCNKEVNILETLLKHGADVDAPTEYGITALHMATKIEHADHVQILLNFKGAQKIELLKDLRGNTALHVAVLKENTRIISLLMLAGADPYNVNDDGKTAVQLASSRIASFIEQEVRIATSMKEMSTFKSRLDQQEKTIAELKALVLSLVGNKEQSITKEEMVEETKCEEAKK